MTVRANVEVLREVRDCQAEEGDWCLCFQWCNYHFSDGSNALGYRFIWRREDGSLQAAMGQARIPDAACLFRLLLQAMQAGWLASVENAD